jgi:hypothetical protein
VRHELLDERHCCASSPARGAPDAHVPRPPGHAVGSDLAVSVDLTAFRPPPRA